MKETNHMSRARKRFILWATGAIFVLLAVLLSLINGIGFSRAAEDADRITAELAGEKGRFGEGGEMTPPENAPGGMPGQGGAGQGGRMAFGPDSPEMRSSVRYFTFRFDGDGNSEAVAMQISAFTEDEARAVCEKLTKESVGWTMLTYRYRVYAQGDYTYVTVIDQGRELGSCYRILLYSLIGGAVGVLLSFLFLTAVGKRLLKPLEEADRKQKRFIRDAEGELKIPLTVIEANAERIEREAGPDEKTIAIRRQAKKMSRLLHRLGDLAIYEEEGEAEVCDLSGMIGSEIDRVKAKLDERGVKITSDVEPGITVREDPDKLGRAIAEVAENALKFSLTEAYCSLRREGGHILILAENDCAIREDGAADRVFDRFTRLINAEGIDGYGLGLSFVKDLVTSGGGRIRAQIAGGKFRLKIVL